MEVRVNTDFTEIADAIMLYLPIIGLLAVIQLGLMIFAIIHAVTHPKFRFGNLTLWIILIIVLNLLGPILYFTIGRGEAETEEDDEDEEYT